MRKGLFMSEARRPLVRPHLQFCYGSIITSKGNLRFSLMAGIMLATRGLISLINAGHAATLEWNLILSLRRTLSLYSMKPNNLIMTWIYGLELSRRRAVVVPGQRSVFFRHMEVQLPDHPSIPSEVPQSNLDPRSAYLSPPLILQKTEVFVCSTTKRSLKMWLAGHAQTRLASLNSIPLLVHISTLFQTGIPVLQMHFSILSSWYV